MKKGKIHGWLGYGNKEEILDIINQPEINLVVELGSWYGKSAEFMLKNNKEINLVCIDLWSNDDILQGNQVIPYNEKYSKILEEFPLYETFNENLKEYSTRILPLQMNTLAGLQRIKNLGMQPDAIYIDANHTYKDVFAEIELALKLFPGILLFGDDINWAGVKKAVLECGRRHNFKIIKNRNCWRFYKKLPVCFGKRKHIIIM